MYSKAVNFKIRQKPKLTSVFYRKLKKDHKQYKIERVLGKNYKGYVPAFVGIDRPIKRLLTSFKFAQKIEKHVNKNLHRSACRPELALEQLIPFRRSYHVEHFKGNHFEGKCLSEAVKEVEGLMKQEFGSAVCILPSLTKHQGGKSSGFGFSGKKKHNVKKVGGVMDEMLIEYLLSEGKVKNIMKTHNICTLGIRGHFKDVRLGRKIRGICVEDLASSMIEKVFLDDMFRLVREAKADSYLFLMGKNGIPKVSQLLLNLHPTCRIDLTDYSKFDKRIPHWLASVAIGILARTIQLNKLKVDSDTILNVPLKLMKTLFYHTMYKWMKLELLTHDGHLIRRVGKVGVVPGRVMNTLLQSIVNQVVLRAVYKMHKVPYLIILTEGDDSMIIRRMLGIGKKVTKKMLQRSFMLFNLIVNKDIWEFGLKNLVRAKLLGMFWRNGLMYMPRKEVYQRLIYTENLIVEKGISLQRIVAFCLLSGGEDVVLNLLLRHALKTWGVESLKYMTNEFEWMKIVYDIDIHKIVGKFLEQRWDPKRLKELHKELHKIKCN